MADLQSSVAFPADLFLFDVFHGFNVSQLLLLHPLLLGSEGLSIDVHDLLHTLLLHPILLFSLEQSSRSEMKLTPVHCTVFALVRLSVCTLRSSFSTFSWFSFICCFSCSLIFLSFSFSSRCFWICSKSCALPLKCNTHTHSDSAPNDLLFGSDKVHNLTSSHPWSYFKNI